MSTISPKTTIRLNNRLKEKKSWLLDCPVSGGEIGAKKGKLSIMVGGEKKIFNKTKKLLQILGDKVTYIGKSGSGQITKACNQILVASTMIAVSEILLLAEKIRLLHLFLQFCIDQDGLMEWIPKDNVGIKEKLEKLWALEC